MLALNNQMKQPKVHNSSPKREQQNRLSPSSEERALSYMAQNFSPGSETIIVVVMPCGREDGNNSADEMPYEIKIRKKGNFITTR